MTRDERRVARRLYERIWAQRRQAIYEKLDVEWKGRSTRMETLTLPDGLRVAWHQGDHEAKLADTVLLIVDGQATVAEFIRSHLIDYCHTAIVISSILHAAGYTDQANGQELPALFRMETDDDALKLSRFLPTQTRLEKRLDQVAADEIARISHHAYQTDVVTDSGLRISLDRQRGWDVVWVGHRDVPHRIQANRRSQTAFRSWSRRQTANVLDGLPPIGIAPPPTTGGSARLTRALALCHQALLIDPDLADHSGTPLRPLLEDHVPELLSRHRLATQTADAREIASIDGDLERGISRICGAIDEGLSRIADDRRNALREQLAFLEMRHPDRAF